MSADRLQDRIAELEQAIKNNEQITAKYKRHGKLVPRAFANKIAQQQQDLAWLKELTVARETVHHHRETITQMIEAGGGCCCRSPYVCTDEAVDNVARAREPWTVKDGHVPATGS